MLEYVGWWGFPQQFHHQKTVAKQSMPAFVGTPLFQFSCILVDKAEQDMLTPYALTCMTNTWMLRLHPGVDHSLKGRHIISTLGAIEALEPVHGPILSIQICEM